MDRALVAERLDALQRCVQRVSEKCPGTAEELAADPDRQDIVALNLTRAVQICVDIASHMLAESNLPPPSTMAETFDALGVLGILEPSLRDRLKRAVGFRNIAVHEYQTIDWHLVHRLCRENLEDFRLFAKAVDARL